MTVFLELPPISICQIEPEDFLEVDWDCLDADCVLACEDEP
jgi:hypothetical protein